MTDEKRVTRALEKCAVIFKDEHLNFTEGLTVAESIIVNAFDNAVDDVTSTDELQALIDIAEDFIIGLTNNVTKNISHG